MRPGVGGSPGTVPVYPGDGKLKAVERKMKVTEVVLWCVTCGFGVLPAALVGSDTRVREFSVVKKAKFTDLKAPVFLVIANGIAAGYSLLCSKGGEVCGEHHRRGCASQKGPGLGYLLL